MPTDADVKFVRFLSAVFFIVGIGIVIVLNANMNALNLTNWSWQFLIGWFFIALGGLCQWVKSKFLLTQSAERKDASS